MRAAAQGLLVSNMPAADEYPVYPLEKSLAATSHPSGGPTGDQVVSYAAIRQSYDVACHSFYHMLTVL